MRKVEDETTGGGSGGIGQSLKKLNNTKFIVAVVIIAVMVIGFLARG